MKLLITGGKGMLGRTLVRHWQGTHTLCVADLPEVNVLDQPNLTALFASFRPEAVIHCVAMTQVDACESNRAKAYLLNETAAGNVARAAHAIGARTIAISTDYVFAGDQPGERSEADAPAPKTVYGASKLAGEEAVLREDPKALILRIAWLYGAGGPSFIHTMHRLAQENPTRTLQVVDDQFGNPTSTDAVAEAITAFLARPDLAGRFHVTCEGTTSWFGLAKAFFAETGFTQVDLRPCTTADFPRPAPRPAYSALSKAKLRAASLPPMPTWQEALQRFCATEWPRP